MRNQFEREERLLGKERMEKLRQARVIVFGLGGVGGFAAEALARAGIGALDLVDSDLVCLTNLNRQLIATHKTIGRAKVEVMAERIRDINPDCVVKSYKSFFLPESKDMFDFTDYSYIVDAVDTVAAKLSLAEVAKEAGVPIISCMGAGNKLNPSLLEVADIYETSVCPLARVMRRELKKRGIRSLKVVYSREAPLTSQSSGTEQAVSERPRKIAPGSVSFVPSVAGLMMGGEVIRDLAGL